MLKKFFVVTTTSVYEVCDKSGKGNPNPLVKKIALKGKSEIKIGDCLNGGTMVAICKFLMVYIPEKYGLVHPMSGFERRVEMINMMNWGGHTSLIVALFETKKEALACLKNEDLQPCDRRWIKQTKKVLRTIGEDHPKFEVCRYASLALPCAV